MKKPINVEELLDRVSGNSEFAKLMLDTFFGNLDERVGLLKMDLENRDFDNLAENVHKMKGVVGNLALPQPYSILKEMHREAGMKDFRKSEKLLRQLESSLREAAEFNATLVF